MGIVFFFVKGGGSLKGDDLFSQDMKYWRDSELAARWN